MHLLLRDFHDFHFLLVNDGSPTYTTSRKHIPFPYDGSSLQAVLRWFFLFTFLRIGLSPRETNSWIYLPIYLFPEAVFFFLITHSHCTQPASTTGRTSTSSPYCVERKHLYSFRLIFCSGFPRDPPKATLPSNWVAYSVRRRKYRQFANAEWERKLINLSLRAIRAWFAAEHLGFVHSTATDDDDDDNEYADDEEHVGSNLPASVLSSIPFFVGLRVHSG